MCFYHTKDPAVAKAETPDNHPDRPSNPRTNPAESPPLKEHPAHPPQSEKPSAKKLRSRNRDTSTQKSAHRQSTSTVTQPTHRRTSPLPTSTLTPARAPTPSSTPPDPNTSPDLAEHDKPWRRPGADQTDFFNYGFDEFTWATYCLKQKTMRDAIGEQKNESAKFEMMFGGVPGMPGMMPGAPVAPAAAAPQAQQAQGQMAGMPGMGDMAGMPDMSPDMMNAMMQQMMSSGMDPSQMDFGSFMQQYQQMQGFPQAQQQGFPGQNMGYGGMDGGRNQGNYGNRGRGRRW